MPFNEPPAGTAAPTGVPAPDNAQSSGQFAIYDGAVGPIAKIATVNAILGLLTLGIYRFWGKTRMRRYLWSRVTILDDRLEYTGTPKELLLGFLVAAGILSLLSLGLFSIAFAVPTPIAQVVLNFVYIVGLYFLIAFAVYRARRYRLARTQWRGIRFAQTGSARGYALRVMALGLLTSITLGLAYPYMQTRLQEYRTNNTWFGNRNLVFDGLAYDLFWKWVLTLVLVVPTLGLSILWYKVTEFRYFTSRTRFSSLSFSCTLSTWDVFLIFLLYGFASIVLWFLFFSVGLGSLYAVVGDLNQMGASGELPPMSSMHVSLVIVLTLGSLVFISLLNVLRFVLYLHPMIRAVTRTLTVQGTIDLDRIKQSDQARGGRGEGFADVLDVGAI